MRLSGVVKSTLLLSSKLGMGEPTTGWIIEEFTAQMRAVSKIALHRRSNLATFLEKNGIIIKHELKFLFVTHSLGTCKNLETLLWLSLIFCALCFLNFVCRKPFIL